MRSSAPKRISTHSDIAKALGVTQSTVSRALDPAQQHQVGQRMRERILATAQRLGFRTNALARRLRTKRSEALTVVIPGEVGQAPRYPDFEASNPALMWQEVHGIMHEAAHRGYEVKLMPQFSGDAVLTQHFLEHTGYPFSDAVIFAGLGLARQETATRINEVGIPCVATASYPEALPFPLIAIDQAAGVRQALGVLMESGHHRFAFVAFADDYATSATWRPRYGTFTRTLTEAGLLDQATMLCAPDVMGLRDLFARFTGPLPFSAAFCVNDALATQVMQILRDRSASVAVVGFDDNPLYQRPGLPFASITLPLYELGRRAVQRLVEHLEQPDTPLMPVELLPTQYVAR